MKPEISGILAIRAGSDKRILEARMKAELWKLKPF
jgi:hypothetical protein